MREKDIGKLICRLNNGLHRTMHNSEIFREVEGITSKNGWLIGFLAENRDRTVCQRDLEKEFNITRSTASKVISLMEKKGFVARRGVEGDARLKEIVLTQKALEVVEKVEKSNASMEAQLARGFSSEETDQLADYLLRLLQNVEQIAPGATASNAAAAAEMGEASNAETGAGDTLGTPVTAIGEPGSAADRLAAASCSGTPAIDTPGEGLHGTPGALASTDYNADIKLTK